MADEVNDSHDEAILLLEEELDRICPNLYFDKHHSACCPKYGWMDIVKKMSLKLEMLNKQLKRYGVRTAIQQCKDKFGSLRVYVDTQSMMPAYARLVSAMLEKLHILLDKHLDYKMTTVIDLPSYVNILEEQIDDVEYDYCKDTTSANVRYVERDGKFFRQGAYKRMRSSHDEATRHVIMHTLSMKLHDMAMKVQRWTQRKQPTAMQEFAMQYCDMMSDQIIDEAERESMNVCESCGMQFGQSRLSKRCQTKGWIRNLCQSCAEKSGYEFFIDGELHKGQSCILSKEEVKKQFGDSI